MTRFQLVFRDGDGERSEIRDNNTDHEPNIDGEVLVDGGRYVIRGVEWMLSREDFDGMPRFICTIVASPNGTRPAQQVELAPTESGTA
jgi:hypothetical protein